MIGHVTRVKPDFFQQILFNANHVTPYDTIYKIKIKYIFSFPCLNLLMSSTYLNFIINSPTRLLKCSNYHLP